MRWLIYGAGNIGSIYAARLAQASSDVTILARGKRLTELRERGIQLEDAGTGERTTTRVEVVERLDPDAAYDVVMVALPKHRLGDVLPILAAHAGTPNVLFFCNNAAGPDAMSAALGRERVLFGFPGAAGVPHEGYIRYVVTSAREQPTTIGELDGGTSARVQSAAEELKAAGFPVSISPAIDPWLKTHVAKVLPTFLALARAGFDPQRLADDDETLALLCRSMREGVRVLEAKGIPITPANHRVLGWLPSRLLRWLLRRMLRSKSTAIKLGHAAGGQAEWRLIAQEFRALIDQAGIATPATNELYRALDPAMAPPPEEQPSTSRP